MTTPASLLAQAERLVDEACASLDVAGMPGGELTDLLDAAGALRRAAERVTAAAAAEVSRQSRRELGKDSLARRQGYRSPQALIATITGASSGDAVKMMKVGEATAPRRTISGEKKPAKHPHVAAALASGKLGTNGAAAIVELLDRLVVRTGAEACLRMEERLVERIPGQTPDVVRRILIEAAAALDPDGVEQRHDVNREARELRTRQDRDGMTVITGRLDAETAAPIVTLLDAEVTRVIRHNEQARDEALKDRRSIPQIHADALADLARHVLGCDHVPSKPTTTVVVRMNVDDLLTATGRTGALVADGMRAHGVSRTPRGEGLMRIDGVEQPLPVSAIRRMAADAGVIPMVLGREGQILDLGRRERLFTRHQKLALVERDRGCAFCGAPPGHTVVHHVEWWSRGGPTDLENGLLLCTQCHHRVHDDGWDIRIDGRRVEFIPPSWLDHTRTPRASARERYELAA